MRFLADMLAPLVGKTNHYVKNSKELMKELTKMRLEDNEEFCSYDVVSLFTKTAIPQALEVIQRSLCTDDTLKKRSRLKVDDIMELLEFTLTTTYFTFRGEIYRQLFGTAMGSPVSPIVANLFMENLAEEAVSIAPETCQPRLWKRYIDDMLVIIKKGQALNLMHHINTVDPTGSIKFTHEPKENGMIPFLDTKLQRGRNGEIKATVYRKKTCTNQYLAFSSHIY